MLALIFLTNFSTCIYTVLDRSSFSRRNMPNLCPKGPARSPQGGRPFHRGQAWLQRRPGHQGDQQGPRDEEDGPVRPVRHQGGGQCALHQDRHAL